MNDEQLEKILDLLKLMNFILGAIAGLLLHIALE
jgi:hypothetical protein